MRISPVFSFFIVAAFFICMSLLAGSCAQVGVPTGGAKDTLAPKLVRATPAYGSRNVTGNKITLEFNEYIDVQDLQQNLVISPLQTRNPSIITNTKSISVKFRDSLLPNTTYTINFGNSVRDINEGNIYKDLSYTFSTGSSLDSLSLSGKVFLAETGLADSSLIVMLYRNTTDSAVKTQRPNYIARVSGDGGFHFDHLPNASFRIYALKDGDGGKTYNSLAELFAFYDDAVTPANAEDITLFAYAQQKAPDNKPLIAPKSSADKKLRAGTSAQLGQDLLMPLEISFNNALKEIDSSKIYITDTFFHKLPGIKISTDSTAKKILLSNKWQAEQRLILIIEKDAVKDSAGTGLAKNDTVRFNTKRLEDYGSLTLRFSGLDLKKKPVLEFLNGSAIKFSYPLTSAEWVNKMFVPGDYGIRILYDSDGNGVWTPGDYAKKLQPEIAVTLPQTLNVRADWDNEREINL